MTVLVKAVAILIGGGLMAGYLGALHPAGDSFAVFRLELALLFALAVIWTAWPRLLRWPLASLAMGIVPFHVVKGAGPDVASDYDVTLYQQNMLFNRADGGAGLLDNIARVQPDIITLQEVSQRNRAVLDELRADYPFQHLCPVGPLLGEAVLSRFPVMSGSAFCSNRDGLAGVQFVTPQGPVWVVSVHLNWPWPMGQAQQVDALLPDLQRLDGAAILAGDFNAVAWSLTLARMSQASGAKRVGPWFKSFDLPLGLPIGIDHVLSTGPNAQHAFTIAKNGSDHHGVVARLSIAAGG